MVIALAISVFLWMVAQGSNSIDRAYDIPVIFIGTSDNLVITDQNAGVINVRIRGRRTSMNSLDPDKLGYEIDLAGLNAGRSNFEVDLYQLEAELPRGLDIVARSPSLIEVEMERRWTQTVNLRSDIDGLPAEGFELGAVTLKPNRVRITGARSEVKRLKELSTETISIADVKAPIEREVRVSINARTVWLADEVPIMIKVEINPIPPIEPEVDVEAGVEAEVQPEKGN
jgi:YbbR domain-containing protein